MFESPNLDGMAASDLEPLAQVLEQLATYARIKARAMRHRERGDIWKATHAEVQCERIYQALPTGYRW